AASWCEPGRRNTDTHMPCDFASCDSANPIVSSACNQAKEAGPLHRDSTKAAAWNEILWNGERWSEQDPAPVLNSAVFSTSQHCTARARAKAAVAAVGRKPASDALLRRHVVARLH